MIEEAEHSANIKQRDERKHVVEMHLVGSVYYAFKMVSSDTFIITHRDEADYVLVDIRVGYHGEGKCNTRLGLSSVIAIRVYYAHLEVTAFYADVKTDLRHAGLEVRRAFSRVQFGADLYPWGIYDSTNIVRSLLYVGDCEYQGVSIPKLTALFNGDIDIDHSKVSARHLRHISIHELRRIGLAYFVKNTRFVLPLLENLMHYDLHEAMLAGVLIWADLLPEPIREFVAHSMMWGMKFRSMLEWAKWVKEHITLRAKALQNLVDIDLTPIFEFEVLVNRGIGVIDWQVEQDIRVNPNVVNLSFDTVYNECTKLFRECLKRNKRPYKTSWQTYWSKRWEWAPTGAVHSQHDEDARYYSTDRGNRHKLFTLNAMPEHTLDYFLRRDPEIHAWSAIKYEWGKERAIYGTDLTSFILYGFAMHGCEDVLHDRFPVGESARADIVHETVKLTLRDALPYCLDYANFNAQHSFSSMKAVITAYRDSFSHLLTEDQLVAFEWCIEAVDSEWIHVGDDVYKSNGTLLSGWRLTTFINTVLNYVYIAQCVPDMAHYDSLHNGDDVLCPVTNFKFVQMINNNARAINIEFQQSKCFLGAIAEFLRVDHARGGGAQYLARGVSTFVHGPTESMIPNDVRSVIESMKSRRDELIERRADQQKVEMYYQLQLEATARLFSLERDTLDAFLSTHHIYGGASSDRTPNVCEYDINTVVSYTDEPEDTNKDEAVTLPGVSAYAWHVCQTIIQPEYYHKVHKSARAAVFRNSFGKRFTIQAVKRGRDLTRCLNVQQAGRFKNTVTASQAQLLRRFNVPLASFRIDCSLISAALAQERDPIWAMRVYC